MQFFINEWSLQSQFYTAEDFDKAAREMIELVTLARSVSRGRAGLYRSARLDLRSAIGTDPLPRSINSLRKEVREALVDVVYNRSSPVPWEQDRRHAPPDTYHWLRVKNAETLSRPRNSEEAANSGSAPERGPAADASSGELTLTEPTEGLKDEDRRDVGDTSMAELAERIICGATQNGCLLNFRGSELSGRNAVDIVKNDTRPASNVASFDTKTTFDSWLSQFRGVKPYDVATATDPPIDEQTCLVDAGRFRQTSRPKQQGRSLYEERHSQDIYYVDNLHFGRAAHLEVFSRMGTHKGKASLDGVLLENTREKDKDYTLK